MATVLPLCCYLLAGLTDPTEQKKPGHFRDRAFPILNSKIQAL